MIKKFLALVIFLAIFSYAYSINFSISPIADIFKTKVVAVHFGNAWNNVKWFMIITYKKKLVLPVNISIWGESIYCNYKLKWYYYNPGHWEDKIYPLDEETLNAWGWSPWYSIEWWLYMWCNWWDPNAVYWKITYKSWSTILYQLIAGTKYYSSSNDIKTELANNLEYGTIPWVMMWWLIYDTMYWIGFVGGTVNNWFTNIINVLNSKKVSKVFWANFSNNIWVSINTPFSSLADWFIAIQWLANLASDSYNTSVTTKMQKELLNQNTQKVLSVKVVNIYSVLNKLRKNSNILCRGKWEDISYIYSSDAGKVLCIAPSGDTVKITDNLAWTGKWTTIIVKWENKKVIVEKSQVWNWYTNIFVDNGYIIFPNSINLVKVDKNWQYNPSNYTTKGAYFKWDLIVKWIIAWGDSNWNLSTFNHKLYVYWKLIWLNTIWDNEKRNKMIEELLWTSAVPYVNLAKSFVWYCTDNWNGSDGINCSDLSDKYNFNSLIVHQIVNKNPLLR